jgi:hypothetical protein
VKSTVLNLKSISDETELTIKRDPISRFRVAILRVVGNSKRSTIELVNPTPLSALIEVFADCYEIRIIDRNVEEKGQQEFGRYRVEIWDEDNKIAFFSTDSYKVKDNA